MVRPERDTIGSDHPVEVDECFVGGETRGKGRGVHHKSIVVGAVEVRSRREDGKKHRRKVHAGRLRLRVVPDRSTTALTGFVKDNVTRRAIIRTDGWTGYPGLGEAYRHESLTLGGDPDKAEAHLPMIHLVFSNLKTSAIPSFFRGPKCNSGLALCCGDSRMTSPEARVPGLRIVEKEVAMPDLGT